jgi:hypothetical protein
VLEQQAAVNFVFSWAEDDEGAVNAGGPICGVWSGRPSWVKAPALLPAAGLFVLHTKGELSAEKLNQLATKYIKTYKQLLAIARHPTEILGSAEDLQRACEAASHSTSLRLPR